MTFLIIFHAIICIMLAIIILMQAGRKGGLTEAFASTENMLGTKTNSFMVTATTIFCVLFFVTSLALAVLSSQKSKSLMTDANIKPQSAAGSLDKDVEAVKKEAVDAAAAAQGAVKTTVDQAAQAASQTVETVNQAVTTTADQVVEAVDQAADVTAQAVADASQQAVDQVQAAAQDVQQAVEKTSEQPVPAQ